MNAMMHNYLEFVKVLLITVVLYVVCTFAWKIGISNPELERREKEAVSYGHAEYVNRNGEMVFKWKAEDDGE